VSLPLNSSLIQGSQSLFGVKTQLQFGRLTATALFLNKEEKTRSFSTRWGTNNVF